MCGIAGGVWTDARHAIDEPTLRRMLRTIAHRGPDDEGVHFSPRDAGPNAALGHRRLSIIDVAGGHQPLSNEDGTVWIVFNGEIYNEPELRPQLESAGHRFATKTDTEVIVHLYEEFGVDFVSRLRGMYAFALWDEPRRRLVMARDRLGQKPLFYRQTDRQLTFASELKALLQVPDAPRQLSPRAVDRFMLYQYVPHPECILEGYSKLPPGHFAVYEDGTLTVRQYWSPPYAEPSGQPTLDDTNAWSTGLRERLTEAVKLRMRSDVPLGAFLSGGVDSTIIVGLMQQLAKRPVKTFSIGFPVEKFDERSFAKEAASFLKTEHHEFVVSPEALSVLPRLIWHYDEPFGDSSAIPTMALSDVTREHVTVALSGDGGDELFAGYDRYRAVRIGEKFDRLPRFLRKIFTAKLWQRIPASVQQKSFRRRLKRLLGALGQPRERRYLSWIAIFDDERRRGLYTEEFRRRLGETDAAEFLLAAYRACPERDFVTQTTCADVLTYLPCDILTKVDIASMSVGLECRSPFLDHHVAEWAARMPIEQKIARGRGKQILTKTFGDLLPPSIQQRPKMGFGVPLDHWFRDELRPLLNEILLSDSCLQRGLFQPEAVHRLVDEHQQESFDHSYRLWSLLVLECWQRTFIDPSTAPQSQPTEF